MFTYRTRPVVPCLIGRLATADVSRLLWKLVGSPKRHAFSLIPQLRCRRPAFLHEPAHRFVPIDLPQSNLTEGHQGIEQSQRCRFG